MSGKMRFVSILALLALLCGLAFAQTETGSIIGTVTDPQGAVVAGAKVTVTNNGTGAERSTMTNSNGLYSVTNLQPGDYSVKIEAANFQPATKKRFPGQIITGVARINSMKLMPDSVRPNNSSHVRNGARNPPRISRSRTTGAITRGTAISQRNRTPRTITKVRNVGSTAPPTRPVTPRAPRIA